jgi:hypothetical protein
MNLNQYEAAKKLYPSIVGLNGDTFYDNNEHKVLVDIEAITTEVLRLQAAYDAQAYSRSRKAKYDLLNQDEMRYDDLINSTTTWQDAITAIKERFPK